MFNLLNGLRRAKQEKEKKASIEWRDLVVLAASDKPMNEADTLAALERLGRSVDDLEAAIALIKNRRQEQEKVALGEKAEVEIQKIEKQMNAAAAKFEPVKAEYETTIDELSDQRQLWLARRLQSREATDRLIRSCTDPEALASHQLALQKESEAQQELQRLSEEAREAGDVFQRRQAAFENEKSPSEKERMRASLEATAARSQDAQAKLVEARARVKSASDAISSACLRMAKTDI